MNKFVTRVGDGGEVVAAVAASIGQTVLSMTNAALSVHADQTAWTEVTPTPADHGDAEDGDGDGEVAWG